MNIDLPVLSATQYSLVFNMLSFSIATMFAAFVFFIIARGQVGNKYSGALTISALIVFIAGYHYFRISESWAGAYQLVGGVYEPTGMPFNDAYRYVDWLLTVPLLVAELIVVLKLPKGKSGSLITKLVIAATLMIITGYPGEITNDVTTRAIWGFISTIPFAYILYVLWVELGQAMGRQPEKVSVLLRNTRLIILFTWGFYPIAYMFPMFGIGGAAALVGVQVGYTIADVLAKAGYGMMIFWIAHEKTQADKIAASSEVEAVPAAAAS